MENRGSTWRKWDLHVHSPASDGYKGDWDQFEQQIKVANCDVIGINDYFSVAGYKRTVDRINTGKLDIGEKVLFPVVEFRMRDVLRNKHENRSGDNLNFHLIFDPNLEIQKIETFLMSLKVDGAQIANKYEDKKFLKETAKVYFENDVIIQLKENKDFKNKFLVLLPYSEHGGIDNIDPNSDDWIKRGFIEKSDFLGSSNKDQIDFFLWRSPKKNGIPKFKDEDFKRWFGTKKACIKGSDSHDYTYPIGHLRDSKSNPVDKFCWIKCDPTFEGLKQVIYEPEQRIKIKDLQPDLKDQKLVINRVRFHSRGSKVFNPNWLHFNPNLNVIIGGKSSGKSILLQYLARVLDKESLGREDIIQYVEEYRFEDSEEFDFEVELFSGKARFKDMNIEPAIPHLKFIPQGYLAKLIDGSRRKTNRALMKYIRKLLLEDDEYNEAYHSDFIQNVKSNDRKREFLINQYFEIEEKIKGLESKRSDKGDKRILEENVKNNELKVGELKQKVGLTEEQIEVYNKQQTQLDSIQSDIQQLNTDYKKVSTLTSESLEVLNTLRNKVTTIVGQVNSDKIQQLIQNTFKNLELLIKEIDALTESLSEENGKFKNQNLIGELGTSLRAEEMRIKAMIAPFIENQEVKNEITQLENTISNDKAKLKAIEEIQNEIQQKKDSLNKAEVDIFNLYENNQKEYPRIIEKLNERARKASDDRLEIKGLIKYRVSKFSRAKDEFTDLRKNHLIQGFSMLHDDRDLIDFSHDLGQQIRDIFKEIVGNRYPLKKSRKRAVEILLEDHFVDFWETYYDGDEMSKMSTGKASFVILRLIAELGESKAPILIDQPEDNLDNRSISKELVEYLRSSKLERQIILVTHNANVVVNADSENIIVANQKGQNDRESSSPFRFDYINGALENSREVDKDEKDLLKSMGIREHIAEIVEGGKEAFKKREEKYGF